MVITYEEKILDQLICPKTGSKLELKGEILVNEKGDKYQIKNEIPVFITEEDRKKTNTQ